MDFSRRAFLKIAGAAAAAFASSAILRGQMSQRKEFTMEIKRIGSQPSSKGPADWFTGTVRIDPLFQANAPARAAGASVTFEPRRTHRVAHASAWSDADRHEWLRLRAT